MKLSMKKYNVNGNKPFHIVKPIVYTVVSYA